MYLIKVLRLMAVLNILNHNVEIHARSIFLQGLIGMNVNAIPYEFSELKSHILNWYNELKFKLKSIDFFKVCSSRK